MDLLDLILVSVLLPCTRAQLVNLALGRPATQTLTLNYLGKLWAAGLAVDGCGQAEIIANKRGNIENSRCCSGSISSGSFEQWRVTLGQTYQIDNIVIEGRFDRSNQLSGFKAYVELACVQTLVYDHLPPTDATRPITVNVNRQGDAVMIVRTPGPLVLCEVKVMGSSITGNQTTAAITTTATPATRTSVARGRPTEQLYTQDYFWMWSSDKAVDGCYKASNPNNPADQCCAASDATPGQQNYWRVLLDTQYLVDKIDIYSRGDDINQLSGFQVFGETQDGFPEFRMYTDTTPYTCGNYSITFNPPELIRAVSIRRSDIITLCEVDVFGVPAQTPTTAVVTTVTPAPPTTTTAAVTTVTTATPTTTSATATTVTTAKPTTTRGAIGPTQIPRSAINVTANGTRWSDWTADKVNDGVVHDRSIHSIADYCNCCMTLGRPSWVQITLDKIYLVQRVLVLGREDIARGHGQFAELQLSMGLTEESLTDEQFTSTNATIEEKMLTPPREIQFVRVTGRAIVPNDVMTICEMMIYRQADCPHGSYSVNCSKQCYCRVGPCDSVTGACGNGGCKDGWKGKACNEIETTDIHTEKFEIITNMETYGQSTTAFNTAEMSERTGSTKGLTTMQENSVLNTIAVNDGFQNVIIAVVCAVAVVSIVIAVVIGVVCVKRERRPVANVPVQDTPLVGQVDQKEGNDDHSVHEYEVLPDDNPERGTTPMYTSLQMTETHLYTGLRGGPDQTNYADVELLENGGRGATNTKSENNVYTFVVQ